MIGCMLLPWGEASLGTKDVDLVRILVLNQYTNNFGDDAAGVALLYQIRQYFPDAHVNVVYAWNAGATRVPYDDAATVHHSDLAFRRDQLPHIAWFCLKRWIGVKNPSVGPFDPLLALIRSADVVVVAPCGASIGIYKDWLFLGRTLLAVLENKSPIFHLNTIGESGNYLFDLVSRFVLKRSLLYVREEKSVYELQRWGLRSIRGVDTVFSMPSKPLHRSDRPYLAIVPTKLATWHVDFRGTDIDRKLSRLLIREVAEFSLRRAMNIKLLPHLHGALSERHWLIELRRALILEGLEEDDVQIVSESSGLDAYEQGIACASLVLSMRYHGLIYAVKYGVPFLALSYENKMLEAARYAGMGEYSLPIAEVEAGRISNDLERAYRSHDSISKRLLDRVPILDSLARLPLQNLWLERSGGSAAAGEDTDR